MATVHKVYMGSCSVGGAKLACTNITAGLEIRPGFFDHVIGKLDNNASSKGAGGNQKIQKRFWRYMPGLAKLNASGVGTEGSLGSLVNAALNCTLVSASCSFWNGGDGQDITNGYISNLTIDCRAGDNINFTVEVTGKDIGSRTGQGAFNCSRLSNWTGIKISSGVGNQYVGFSLTINNPIKPVYTSAIGYLPDELRVGMQEITGSVSCTENKRLVGPEDHITISSGACGGFSAGFDCVFEGTKNTGDAGGIFIATTNFTAVT